MADESFPRVSTRGHFWITWFHGEKLRDGHSATDFDRKGKPIPGWDGDAPDELLVHAHGFMNTERSAIRLFETMRQSLRKHGYDHPVVGFSWDSNWNPNRWWSTVRIAKRNGTKLAQFVREYRKRNPDTTVRVTGHSLGGQVAVSTLDALRAQNGKQKVGVASASLLGAAVRAHAVAQDGEYGPAISAVPGRCDNFYSSNDWVLLGAFGPAELSSAVGRTGAKGSTPDGYADHDVSDQVNSHFDYVEPDRGCIGEVVKQFG